MAFISIVIPVYNVEKHLNRCVDSLINQTYKNFEIVLVDDGSLDNSGKICDRYALEDNRIHVIHQSNMGLSGARNSGIDWIDKNSDCDWIGFIDSDDWVHEQYLESLIKTADVTGAGIIICEYLRTEGETVDIKEDKTIGSIIDKADFYINHTVTATTAWGKLYKRALFNNVRFPLGKLHEDEFVTYKILFNCDDAAYIDQPLYYYYQNPEGIMLSKWNPRRMDAFEAFEEQSEFFKNLPSVYEAQGRRYMRNLMNTLEVIKDDSEYKQYQKIIHKKLKQLLFRYRKEIPWKTVPNIAETEYPLFMKVYWVVFAQYYKLAKHFKNHSS